MAGLRPGHPRLIVAPQVVDARNKSGHDELWKITLRVQHPGSLHNFFSM
jgi:hypothetical protein